jgi:stage III sporulation protein AH
MKNIFKKNQIIITALAIMIAIAGYLNFSGRNDEDKNIDIGAGEVLEYETYSETAGDDLTENDDIVSVEGSGLVDITEGLLDETGLDEVAEGEETEAGEDVVDTAANPEEVADISDEDMATEVAADDVEQLEVADNGEIIVEDTAEATDTKDSEETSAPGEAILVSTTLEPNFFANAKLLREQKRSLRKEELMDIVDNDNISESLKEEAIGSLISLAALVEKEDATETLLKAKGFSDAVVSINPDGGNVDVIINAVSITDQDTAKISDIVQRKTGIAIADIVISPVVAED